MYYSLHILFYIYILFLFSFHFFLRTNVDIYFQEYCQMLLEAVGNS